MKNAEFNRSLYEKLAAQYGAERVSPATLRAETITSNSESNPIFKILEDTSIPVKTESRLNKNDLFYMTSIRISLSKRIQGKEGNAILYHYPNAFIFGAQAPDLESVFNSNIIFEVGQKKFMSLMKTRKCLAIPQTQQTSATNRDEQDGDAGFAELPVHYKLRGTDDIVFSIKIPTFAALNIESAVAGTDYVMVLEPDGFLLKNGANEDK